MNTTANGEYLKTLNPSGTPPETRIGDANQARAIWQMMEQADEGRDRKRALVKGLVDGNPPYSQSALKAAGLGDKCNINFRVGESYKNQAVGAFYDLFSEAPTYATIQLGRHEKKPYSDEQLQTWSRQATVHFDWLCRYEPCFDYNMQLSQDEMVMFGVGPMMFPDFLDWKPMAVLAGQLKVPERAKSDTEYWELAGVKMEYLCDELWSKIKDPEAARNMGWNVERVKQAIINASPETQKGGVHLNWEWHQQQLKNGSIYYAMTSKVISVSHIFCREFAKRGEKAGKITHVIVIRDYADTTTDKFLFQKVRRFKDWNECLHPMYYDRGSGGFHYGCTGMGVKMYSVMDLQNRTLCNNADKAFTPKIMFKPTTSTGADNFALQQYGDFAVLCLDSQTEILTSNGWIGMGKMNLEHKVANWSEDGTVFFDHPKLIIERQRLQGERMVSIENGHNSIRVTEHHRMLVKKNGSGFKIIKALDLAGKKCEIPISGMSEPLVVELPEVKKLKSDHSRRLSANAYTLRKLHGMTVAESRLVAEARIAQSEALHYTHPSNLTLEQCKLIGFWIGDGSRCKLSSGGVEYTLCQSAAAPAICDNVAELLLRSGVDFIQRKKKTKAGSPFFTWSLPRGTGFGKQGRKGVFSIEPYLDKGGSKLIWGLNESQFDSLIDGLWMADGSHGNNTTPRRGARRITGINRDLFNLLQAVACVRGYRASILTERNPRKSHYKPLLTLSLTKRKLHSMTKQYRLKVEENWTPEMVWCVTSTTGNIITRRHGFVTITGNTEGFDAVQTPMSGIMEEGLVFNRELTNLISSNLSQYRSNAAEPVKGNPDTATKVKLDASKEASLQKTQMARYYQQMDGLYGEMYRRAASPDVTDPRAKEFQKRCEKDGIPLECLRVTEWVKASRVVGQGSEFLRQQSTEFLFGTVLPMLPEGGRANLIDDVIASRAGQSAVDRYNPKKDASTLPDDQYAWAMSQVADMKIGVPAVPTENQNPMIFAQTFLQAADQAAGTLEQGADPREVASFLNLAGQAIAVHLSRMAQDPSRKAQVDEMEVQWKQLAQVHDQLVEAIQEQQAEAQSRQQQMQQRLSEDQMEMMMAKERQDAELAMKKEKNDFGMAEKGAKTRQQLALKDLSAAQTLKNKELAFRQQRQARQKNSSQKS